MSTEASLTNDSCVHNLDLVNLFLVRILILVSQSDLKFAEFSPSQVYIHILLQALEYEIILIYFETVGLWLLILSRSFTTLDMY